MAESFMERMHREFDEMVAHPEEHKAFWAEVNAEIEAEEAMLSAMPVSVHVTEVSPGTGVSCEDCGYTPDELLYEEFSDGSFRLHISAGCTGGASANELNVEHALEMLKLHDDFEEAARREIRDRIEALQNVCRP